MPDQRMARADLVTALVLFVLGMAVIYGGWTMDRLPFRRIHPLSVPGLLPGLLGVALTISSVLLFLQAVRAGGHRGWRASLPEGAARPWMRAAVAAALCLSYPLGMIGRMPFWLATAIFVSAFIALFEWEGAASARAKLVRLAWAAGLGLATGLIVSYVFRELFLVRLP